MIFSGYHTNQSNHPEHARFDERLQRSEMNQFPETSAGFYPTHHRRIEIVIPCQVNEKRQCCKACQVGITTELRQKVENTCCQLRQTDQCGHMNAVIAQPAVEVYFKVKHDFTFKRLQAEGLCYCRQDKYYSKQYAERAVYDNFCFQHYRCLLWSLNNGLCVVSLCHFNLYLTIIGLSSFLTNISFSRLASLMFLSFRNSSVSTTLLIKLISKAGTTL